MNDLNSVLLEGSLAQAPVLSTADDGEQACLFRIITRRTNSKLPGADAAENVSSFTIKTYGKLAARCHGSLSAGRGVRVVGFLHQQHSDDPADQSLLIVAEHVEFRPHFRRPEPVSEDLVSAR